MKLLIIRHGDPDYEHDTLTPTGHIEAALAAERLAKEKIAACYLSPLGRAQDTARYTLERMHLNGITLDWLREFDAPIPHPDTGDTRIPWDWLPAVWTAESRYYDRDAWAQTPPMLAGKVREKADAVCAGMDALLAGHGYVRERQYYRAEHPNRDTLAFFCHFGVECLLLSHLIGVSPMVLWHGFCAAPASVTTVYTEERREGIAAFRIHSFGDTGHLIAGGREPSFSKTRCI